MGKMTENHFFIKHKFRPPFSWNQWRILLSRQITRQLVLQREEGSVIKIFRMAADVRRRVDLTRELYCGAVWDKLLKMLVEKIHRIWTSPAFKPQVIERAEEKLCWLQDKRERRDGRAEH
jgi:hypothetical protein